jgi:hypothetical protein
MTERISVGLGYPSCRCAFDALRLRLFVWIFVSLLRYRPGNSKGRIGNVFFFVEGQSNEMLFQVPRKRVRKLRSHTHERI